MPELVAATGVGNLGGFTLFQVGKPLSSLVTSLTPCHQRDLPVRRKRKILAISGSRGIWSLPIRQPLRNSTAAYGQDNDTLILSTDINPSPGSSRVRGPSFRGVFTI